MHTHTRMAIHTPHTTAYQVWLVRAAGSESMLISELNLRRAAACEERLSYRSGERLNRSRVPSP